MLQPGSPAPSLPVGMPSTPAGTVIVFIKVTCPTCALAAPKIQALADSGARVVAIGQDPPEKLADFAARHGIEVPLAADLAPYPASEAYEVAHVPTLVLVGPDGLVGDVAAGWDRDAWNRVAQAAGAGPVSAEGDGMPSFRPG